jgi:hypothetical protein
MHTDLKLELSAKNLALGSSPDLYAFQFVHKHVFNKNGGLRVGLLNLRMPPGAISHPPDPGLHGPLSHPTDQGPTCIQRPVRTIASARLTTHFSATLFPLLTSPTPPTLFLFLSTISYCPLAPAGQPSQRIDIPWPSPCRCDARALS